MVIDEHMPMLLLTNYYSEATSMMRTNRFFVAATETFVLMIEKYSLRLHCRISGRMFNIRGQITFTATIYSFKLGCMKRGRPLWWWGWRLKSSR